MENQTHAALPVAVSRLVRHLGPQWVACIDGRSVIGATREHAFEGLREMLFPFFVAYCPKCGWLDSSENAAGGEPTGGDDYTDAICPKCCADPSDPDAVGENVGIEEFFLPNVDVDAPAHE